MGEEVKITDYDGASDGGGDEDRVLEWEVGLPTVDDLTPLSQPLIPPELASAFSITPEAHRSILDVNRASQNTLSGLRGQTPSSNNFNFKSFDEEREIEPLDEEMDESDPHRVGSDTRKAADDDPSARALKRPRLVWTPQLHKRFVDVVAHLGITNAVPKTIMQLMNVEGLTRENVASHLQKYRLYLKRMQGMSDDGGPSSSDHLFASNLNESGGSGHQNGHVPMPIRMPYGPHMGHIPVFGMGQGQGHGHMGMSGGNLAGPGSYHGFDSHPYNMVHWREWSGDK